MDEQIYFPNLGIKLEHVGKNIQIGNFSIAYYGIIIGLGLLIGLGLAMWRAKETEQKPDDYIDIVMITMFVGVIGARIYYVLFQWSYYQDHLLSIFNLREGGLAIYGGLLFGIATLFVLSKVKKIPFGKEMDTIALSVVTGQMLGRWGNFFNREAFGEYTNNLFAMQLPTSAVRASEITPLMKEHLQTINGVEFIQVHPTFLYESLWNLGVICVLLLLRKKIKFEGELFALYLMLYSVGRFFIESLRTDQLLLPGTSVPVSMVVAVLLFLICGYLIVRGHLRRPAASE